MKNKKFVSIIFKFIKKLNPFQRKIKSLSKEMVTFGDKKSSKSSTYFECNLCDYTTSKKFNYEKHLQTIKHSSMLISDACDKKVEKVATKYLCDKCSKEYNSRNGLWQHKKKCLEINKSKETNTNEDKEKQLTEIIKTLITENSEIKNLVIIQQKNMEVQQNTITELVKNGITNNNSHNTTTVNNNKAFNLNFFLNETCKDAMNMSEFINSLQIAYEDFEKVGEIGFVNGISNIIIKNLKDLDVTQRPMHCTDKKREVLYVKEDNKWEKEDENYTKTRKLIKKTTNKNMLLIPEFKKRYPDCGTAASKYSDKYDLLLIETMGGSGDNDYEKETKILKNIAREVVIEKVL